MIRPNDRGQAPIIYIMLSDKGQSTFFNVAPLKPSPTPPPTHFFSVDKSIPALCPPIF